jgi:hypothetical protein
VEGGSSLSGLDFLSDGALGAGNLDVLSASCRAVRDEARQYQQVMETNPCFFTLCARRKQPHYPAGTALETLEAHDKALTYYTEAARLDSKISPLRDRWAEGLRQEE